MDDLPLQAKLDYFKLICQSLNLSISSIQIERLSMLFRSSKFIYEVFCKFPEFFLTKEFDCYISLEDVKSGLLKHCPLNVELPEFKKNIRIYRNQLLAHTAMVHYFQDNLKRGQASQLDYQDAQIDLTMAHLSNIADALISWVNGYVNLAFKQKYGIPSVHGKEQSLIILALGKLGGCELNFSSDIDIVFIYPENGPILGKPNLTIQMYFDKISKQIIEILSQVTEDGFVYRVDCRLRPFGDSGPLVSNFDALEKYYAVHGREWERYALIKSRCITGDTDDVNELYKMLRSFVYRRYLDYTAFESLRNLQSQIEQEVRLKNLTDNIKLGPGGIRQIEFMAQAHQLIRGGKEPIFQSNQLLKAYDIIKQQKKMQGEIVEELIASYHFLRNFEHYIQAYQDMQTHDIPTDDSIQKSISTALGFTSWDSLIVEINKTRQLVSNQFRNLSAIPKVMESKTSDLLEYKKIWLEDFTNINERFKIPEQELKKLTDYIPLFKKSYAFRQLSAQGLKRIDTLIPSLLQFFSQASIKNVTPVIHIFNLIESIMRRSAYLALLIERPNALQGLIHLCLVSPWIIEQIAKYPVILDEVLDIDNTRPFSIEMLQEECDARLKWFSKDDLEQIMDHLRQLKLLNTIKFITLYCLNRITLDELQSILTGIATLLISKAYYYAFLDITGKISQKNINQISKWDDISQLPFIIVAFGKLGAKELLPSSDIDLVFIFDDMDNENLYIRLAQRIIHIVSTATQLGNLYEIDVRLRPGGNAGLLVTKMQAFENYQLTKAWTFEHQALIKADVVCGNESLKNKFYELRSRCLSKYNDTAVLRVDIIQMRKRINVDKKVTSSKLEFTLYHDIAYYAKYQRGGLEDIGFLTQYLILNHLSNNKDFDINCPQNTKEILSYLLICNVLSKEDAFVLDEVYQLCLEFTTKAFVSMENRDENYLSSRLSDCNKVIQKYLLFFD